MADARPAPMFVADATALDFLNSIASPNGKPVEWLASGEDLLDWLQSAQLVPVEILRRVRRTGTPKDFDAVAARARALREWFRGFVAKHKGKRLRAEALKDLPPLNRILERDLEHRQIVRREGAQRQDTPSGLGWQQVGIWQTPDSPLFPIAKSMAELVTNENFSHVRACEGPTCTILFLDQTHGSPRRWCMMAVCGNRAKQAAHRRRRRPTVR
jgi:predicted RNA-binding Zn ribbon-like protein